METSEMPTEVKPSEGRSLPETMDKMRARLESKEGITPSQLMEGVIGLNTLAIDEEESGKRLAVAFHTNYALGVSIASRIGDQGLLDFFATRIASIENSMAVVSPNAKSTPENVKIIGFTPNPPSEENK